MATSAASPSTARARSAPSTLRALWSLGRPWGALLVPLLPLLGYGFAHWNHALAARGVGAIVSVTLAWIALHVGTMWLNAALDHDDGDVLFGRAVAVPPATTGAGILALALCVVLASWANPHAGLCALGCALASFAYSHPRLALKGHPVGGPFINVVGYGILSPLAGWSLVAVPPTPRAALALAVMTAFVAAFYFAAQSFQRRADAARGYRTLVAVHGPRITVRVTRLCWWMGVLGVAALGLVGWFPGLVVAVVPLGAWVDRALHPRPIGASHAQRFAVRAFAFGIALLALVTIHHVAACRDGAVGGGLATRAGHP